MVYFSKKQATSGTATITGNNTFTGTNTFNDSVVVPSPTNANQAANKGYVDNAINGCAKLATANTFTQINTFNNESKFKRKIELKNTSSNNGVYIDNFDYGSENYSAVKFFKGSTNTLQIEVNNNTNTATLSYPGTNNGIHIQNVANPTNDDNVANKRYVDSKVVFIDKTNLSFTRQEIEANKTYKYYTNAISYSSIATGCTGVISVACSDIPASGEHLVITYFPKILGNNVLIEIYQYNSSNNITTQLQQAHFQFVIQKSL